MKIIIIVGSAWHVLPDLFPKLVFLLSFDDSEPEVGEIDQEG